jgi:UDP-N-acetylmuramate dehydrogenase
MLRLDGSVSLPDLCELARMHPRVSILGGGSNVVLAPELPGLTVKVETKGIRLLDQTAHDYIVEAQAGEVWHDFVDHCLSHGWPGLENLALIPGTVGAAPVQNIGAYGVELEQRFHSLLVWDLHAGRQVQMGPADCRFAYRDSVFKHAQAGRWLIVAVRLRLPCVWRPVMDYPDLQRYPPLLKTHTQPRHIFDAVCEIRRAKLPDPAVLGNAGSFFKNPVVDAARYERLKAEYPELPAYPQPDGQYKLAAGWLIDQAGWKGRRVGPVGMHERQALVLVNYGGATAQDVLGLAAQIKDAIGQRFGVELEQEPVVFG